MKVLSFSSAFFRTLIMKLNTGNVTFAIIGDYHDLPNSVGHDIDLWTDDVDGFRKCLFGAIEESGHHVLIDNRTANGCNVAFYKRKGDTLTFMKIDVMKDTAWKSIITLVDKETTAQSVERYKDFYITNPDGEALGHFL